MWYLILSIGIGIIILEYYILKVVKKMSLITDALAVEVAEIKRLVELAVFILQNPGEDPAVIEAITANLKAVNDTLRPLVEPAPPV